jgi:CDP-paratose 2-epimerase
MKIAVIGGAGFIGCNAARRFQKRGHEVIVVDNLSRRGATANLEWLHTQGPLEFIQADVRDAQKLYAALSSCGRTAAVLHLAAQVAVTTSVENPREDFEVNALGTFNVLETIRKLGHDSLVIFASTNKVYGGMEGVAVEHGPGLTADEGEGRYRYRDLPEGVPEDRLLDFHSPYGCSKGAADQYVRDYARIYGIKTVVMRQSCIYGPRQFGIEDQGWVAWFVISAVLGRKIRIYGDGKQVRDLLHVDDLVDVYETVVQRRADMNGRIYNIGGGARFSLSILGLVHMLERLTGKRIAWEHFDWRPGDQPVYISDIRKAEEELGWKPKIASDSGVTSLLQWVEANQSVVRSQLGDLLA